jgi:hypothetical protein
MKGHLVLFGQFGNFYRAIAIATSAKLHSQES